MDVRLPGPKTSNIPNIKGGFFVAEGRKRDGCEICVIDKGFCVNGCNGWKEHKMGNPGRWM